MKRLIAFSILAFPAFALGPSARVAAGQSLPPAGPAIAGLVTSSNAIEDDSQARPRTAAKRPPEPIGFRLYAFSDATGMTASKTFDATLGQTTMTGLGGGGEVLRLWRGVFARVGISTSSAAGQRVLVFEGNAIPLGIPMHVTLTPIEIGGGWRQDLGRLRAFGVYAGGSLVRMRFEQTSDFAHSGENVDETTSGFAAFGGVDYTIARWIVIGAEAQFRTVPDALGADGASKAFGETDLGGVTFRVMFGIRH